EQYYTRALAPLSKPDERAIVAQRIDALYPLPASGPELRAEVTAGFDSNASQSGAANAVGASGTADQSSALTRLSLGLGWTVRTGRNTALTPAYAGSSLLLWQPEVQDLSLHGQELGLAFDWAPTHRLALRLSASAPLYLIGLNEPEPFSFEPGGNARLAVTHDQTMTTRLFLDARLLQGLNGRDALSGHRFELGARETASLGRGALWAEASAGENGMGVSEVGTSPDDFAICSDVLRGPGAACGEGSVYLIPLGYRFIGASLGASTTPLSSLTFSASARVEYRRYLQDSVLLLDPFGLGPYGAPAEYRRLREDVRVAASLRAALALDEAEHYSLLGSYSLLLSTSNIAQNEGGREHALDYDDRNFTQHVVELGLAAHLW
ncbi:MAG TPA: hypothetical protein VM686_25165, partial [Polyangiaceae bacterium]|nr:hypothetical protein [Polyangiaceae bacterium]